MLVRDLDGNLSSWHFGGNISKGSSENKSSYHLKARTLIKELYPTLQILEEVTIHPKKSETMYLDFYLPLIKKCIEVHGEQHYSFVPHYHSNKLAFLKAQKRDRDKKYWCEINSIEYIELSYKEDIETWKQLINP
jgi:hemerythrin-like domain-containing protein